MALILKRKAALPDELVAEGKQRLVLKPKMPPVTSESSADTSGIERKAVNVRPLDSMCQTIIDSHPNAIVSWWLMASYLYERHDLSLLTDEFYDGLSRQLADRYDAITHSHKKLIPREFTKSGFGISFPAMTRSAVRQLIKGEWGVDINIDD